MGSANRYLRKHWYVHPRPPILLALCFARPLWLALRCLRPAPASSYTDRIPTSIATPRSALSSAFARCLVPFLKPEDPA
jgi:hypothetical protein